jgi:hypothetical protein
MKQAGQRFTPKPAWSLASRACKIPACAHLRRRSNEEMAIPTRTDRAADAEVEQIRPRHDADFGAHLGYITHANPIGCYMDFASATAGNTLLEKSERAGLKRAMESKRPFGINQSRPVDPGRYFWLASKALTAPPSNFQGQNPGCQYATS